MMMPSRGERLLEAFGKGFSLLELLVAMAIFLLVSGVSFTLFSRHQALLSQEQVIVGLNIGLRNALAQMQLDVVNAGSGLILGANIPAWPVGVTIFNSNPTLAQCNPTASNPPVYATACFDRLNVVVVDHNTPPVHPWTSCTTCTLSTSSGTATSVYGAVPSVINPATGSLFTAAQLAGKFTSGDLVMFVSASGKKFTTAYLTSAGAVSTTGAPPGAGYVTLTFNSTLSAGANNTCPNPTTYPYTCNDPLGMTANTPLADLTDQFSSGDWVLRLTPITYSVDTSNSADPKLIRTQTGTQSVMMDQVIGFKVGAALWNTNASTFEYNYSSGTYANGSTTSPSDPNDFTLVRSVRVSLIGRTRPDPSNPYRNPFDLGPYQIRGNSTIVDPRNLSMGND